MEHGWPEITIAFGLGALLYQLIQVGCILALADAPRCSCAALPVVVGSSPLLIQLWL